MSVEECRARGAKRTFRFETGEGRAWIRFFPCDLASPNANDIRHRFCARCGQYFTAHGKPEWNENGTLDK